MTTVSPPWYCDSCGDPSFDPLTTHLVLDREGPGYAAKNFRIVHSGAVRPGCDPDVSGWLSVDRLLGPDGLTHLLAELSAGPLKAPSKPAGVADMDGFVDVIRRLQVPGYEEARRRFGDEDVRELYADANEYLPYEMDELQRIASRPLDD